MTIRRAITYGGMAILTIWSTSLGAYSSTLYFKNFGDKEPSLPSKNGASTLDATKCPALATKYRDGSVANTIISAASKEIGVEAAQIAAIIEIESSFDQDATSKDEANDPMAYGLMQTLPPTYNAYNRPTDPDVSFTTIPKGTYAVYPVTGVNTILQKPEAAVFAGTRFYRTLLDKYGDTATAVAAYNWGPGNIDSIWTKGKPLPRERLPKEPRDEITKFQTALEKYRSCQAAMAKSSANGQAIADKATKAIGTGSTCYFSDKNKACAAFTSSAINAVAGTNLDNSAPSHWANGGGQTIEINNVEPGDEVFWTTGTTYQAGDPAYFSPDKVVPTHVGIYIGHYEGPNGRGQTIKIDNAVINNSGAAEQIVVDPIDNHAFYGNQIYGIKRY